MSQTASVDTDGDLTTSLAEGSEPVLDQNRPYALQSTERGKLVMRLNRWSAGRDLWSAIVSRLCGQSSCLRRSLSR